MNLGEGRASYGSSSPVASPTRVVCFNKNSCPNFLITIIHSLLLYWLVSVNHPRAYLNYGATQGTRRVLMHTTQALMRPWYSILGSCSVISVLRRHRRKRSPRHWSRRTSKLRKWTVFFPGPCHAVCSLRALTPVLPIVAPIVPSEFCYRWVL